MDEEKATEDAETLHKECSKGMMGDFKEDKFVRKIAKCNQHQNKALCDAYEREYGVSLAGAIEKRCDKSKFVFALKALLIPKSEFIAQRLEAAMKGFGTDEIILIRLLGGLDSKDMAGVVEGIICPPYLLSTPYFLYYYFIFSLSLSLFNFVVVVYV